MMLIVDASVPINETRPNSDSESDFPMNALYTRLITWDNSMQAMRNEPELIAFRCK